MGTASRSFRASDLGRVEERTKYVKGHLASYSLLRDLLQNGYNFLHTRISNNDTHGCIFGFIIFDCSGIRSNKVKINK